MRETRQRGSGRARVAIFAALLLAVGCAGTPARSQASLRGADLIVLAGWSGVERARFQTVLHDFATRTGARVRYVSSAGQYLPDRLTALAARGVRPDVVLLSEPGLLEHYARAHRLVPLDAGTRRLVADDYPAGWRSLATVDGVEYGVWFKAANKSLIWYDVASLERIGQVPPDSLPGLLRLASALRAAGQVPFSVGAGDGWVLTDWFENVYLRRAGPERYDALAVHRIPWTDASVGDALRWLRRLLGPADLLGGPAGALRTSFPASVTNAFGSPAHAAMVMEGDFVGGFLPAGSGDPSGTAVDVFPFPGTYRGLPVVVGGGDVAVRLTRRRGAAELLRYLATPDAAALWARHGGFVSANLALDLTVYRDPISRAAARQLVEAGSGFRFDLSDLQRAAFGARPDAGMQGALRRFLLDGDVPAAQQALEASAVAAYR